MSEDNRMNDNEIKMSDLFVEAENIYQQKRAEREQAQQSDSAGTDGQSTDSQPKYARTPVTQTGSATVVKASQEVNTDSSEEEGAGERASIIILRIALVLTALVVVAVGGIFAKNYFDLRNSKLEAQKLSLEIPVAQPEEPQTIDEDAVGADGILEKYREYYNQNNDLVGWITVPNTKIDHPVVQAKDNDFYLRKNFSKTYERRGSIFMDFRCDSKNYVKNTILYGHNYLDSTMFSDLEKYKNLDFYKSAPVIEFNSIYKNQKWKVFGVYLSNVDDEDDNGYALYYIHPFMTDDNFEDYVRTVRERSIINIPVDVERTDKILTLSTCTRDMDMKGRGQTNARCVIVARPVRAGEREEVNVDAATYNPNPRYPQIWYTVRGLENPYVDAYRWYPEGDG